MKKAFTLIEFIVILAIIGILSAALVPALKNYMPSWNVNGATRLIVSKLRQAQEEAVSSQNQHLIRFDTTAEPATMQLIKIDSGEQILEDRTFPLGIIINLDPSFPDNQVIFSSDGGPSANGNISISKEAVIKTVNVSPSGVIKIQ